LKLRNESLQRDGLELQCFFDGILDYAKHHSFPKTKDGANAPFKIRKTKNGGIRLSNMYYKEGFEGHFIGRDTVLSNDDLFNYIDGWTDCGKYNPGLVLDYNNAFKTLNEKSRQAFYEGFVYYLKHYLGRREKGDYSVMQEGPSGSIFPRIQIRNKPKGYSLKPSFL